MAHLVQTMAYVGETPWHGLGNQLTPKQPLNVWAKQAGMDWEIKESPVCFMTGKAGHLGGIRSFEDHKVLFRSDSKEPLSVVSNRYKVVQPREILEFYRDLTEISGFELETAGVLKGGRKVWALARTGQSVTFKGDDTTNGYVLLATACDGTLATTAQFTSIRVVCNNTLTIALDGRPSAVKVPHSTTFDPQAVKKQLGICVSSWDAFMYRLKALSERKVKPLEAQNYFLRVFSDDSKPGAIQTSERLMGHALSLFDGKGKGADLASSKGTAFGLLNAVTQFVDHERRARNVDNRLDSAWFGAGADLKQKALDQALAMAA
ncbi:MAG: DUF932 domain-containing protein [Pseudomonadota bacterium]